MTTPARRANRMTATRSAAVAMAMVLAVGCGSSGSSHPAASTTTSSSSSPEPAATQSASPTTVAVTLPDPCTLLTLPEANSLAGSTLSPGQDAPSPDPASPGSCTYTAAPTAPSGQVELFVSLGEPRAYQIDKAVNHTFRNVAGIGDQAIEEPDNNNIFVRKGRLWVYLSIPFGATPSVMERGAKLIAARMP